MADPQFVDTMRNFVSNLGETGKDKQTASEFVDLFISPAELWAIYRAGGIGGKVVDCVADDLARKWRNVSIPDTDTSKFEELEKALRVVKALTDGYRWARLLGGSVVLVEVGRDDPREPFSPSTISPSHPITGLRVLARDEIAPGLLDPRTGRNVEYSVLRTGEVYHASRALAVFDGIPLTPRMLELNQGFGDSVLKRCYQSLLSEASAAAGTTALIHEARVNVVGVQDLSAELDGGQRQTRFETRWRLSDQLKSLINCILIDKDIEEFTPVNNSAALSGLAPLMERFANRISADVDIPMTRLFGKLASGLSTSGETNQQDYYDMLTGIRVNVFDPPLALLDVLICLSCYGRIPEGFYSEWRSLRELTDLEEEDLQGKRAKTAKEFIDMGVALPAHVARYLKEVGPYSLSEEFVQYLEERDGIAEGQTPEGPDAGTEELAPPEMGGTREVQKEALNGLQVSSLLEIAINVKTGKIDKSQAIQILLIAFPTVSREEAENIVTTEVTAQPEPSWLAGSGTPPTPQAPAKNGPA
jgi:phage-related protein (TIGR01555 family)